MNCRRCTSMTSAYLDDRLDAATRSAFDQHVADCAACARALHAQKTLSSVLRAEPAAAAPDGLAERLARVAVAAPSPARPSLLDRWIPVAWPAAAASAVAAALLLVALDRTGGAPTVVDEDPVAAIATDDAAEDDAVDVLALGEE